MAVARNATLNFFIDIIFVSIAFLFCISLKEINFDLYIFKYANSFILFLSIWIINSFAFKKYRYTGKNSLSDVISPVLKSNLLTFGMVASLMYVIRISHYSRFLVLGTIGIATGLEIIFSSIYFWLITSSILPETYTENFSYIQQQAKKASKSTFSKKVPKSSFKTREEALFIEITKNAFNFIFQYANIDSPNTLIISTTSQFNILSQLQEQFESIVNIKRINDVRYLNKFFEAVNQKLEMNGLYINAVETKNLRKKRILKKYPPIINYIVYFFDFIIKRVFPKFNITKQIYFMLTRGQNRVLTKAETFGRLYSCGFEIIAEKYIDNQLFFIAQKTGIPHYPKDPTYGPFVRLRRIGKHGKIIKVLKLRTMHPFAEYLQDYMYKQVGLKEGGKFKDDFRVSTIGKLMRTFWLDELPMLYNILKGDLKIVGVRPLSKQYFNLYTKELQEKRIKYKPGLIPPFYVDNPKTIEEIIESELKYLNAYEKHPVLTDIKYFFAAIFNIIFKRYRSS